MQHEAVHQGKVVHAISSLHDRGHALDELVEGPPVAGSSEVGPAVLEGFCATGRVLVRNVADDLSAELHCSELAKTSLPSWTPHWQS